MHDAGPLGPLFKPVLGPPAAALYARAIARINARYDRGVGVVTLDRTVISVGNLSVGGTGKTPLVAHIARLLRDDGRTPCIAMRGYRSARAGSDEADAYRLALPDIALVVQPDRAAGLAQLFATDQGRAIDTVILDDGFQHRRINRDLDLVLIDATSSPFQDRLLPMGWLREPPAALARAHAVVVTRADQIPADALDQLSRQINEHHGRPPLALTRHAWRSIRSSRQSEPLPVDSIQGLRVLLVCAIANPRALLAQAQQLGLDIADHLFLRDHDPFAARTINRIVAAARRCSPDAILVTEKDWAKLKRVPDHRWPVPVLRPELAIEFITGGDAFNARIRDASHRPTP